MILETKSAEDASKSGGGAGGGEAADTRWAFREDGPWVFRPEDLVWRSELEGLRAAQQADVPQWVAPRRWPPVRRFLTAAGRLGGALLAWRLREGRKPGPASRLGLSRRLRRAFETLGPAYIKLGQIVSSGRGLFPEELVEEFKKCRDQVPAVPFKAVRRVVESELGQPLEAVFTEFDSVPLAAASIAQVHRARLQTGEEVVVKVQRPEVADWVKRDVAAMAWVAPRLVGRIPVAALANPPVLVEVFAETIVEELDFRLEAENMIDIARVLADAGQGAVVVPRPHPRWVTARVLVMERLEGFSYDDVSGMKEAGIDTEAVFHSMMIAFLEGAMIYGVFHGDFHGGNLFVMSDGRVALLDYGITARLDEQQRSAFLRIMMAGAVNDLRGQLAAFRDLGALDPQVDLDALIVLLGADQPVRDPMRMTGEEIALQIQTILKGLLGEGARLPKPLMLYAKNMLFFDGAVAELAPDLDMFAEFVRIYEHFASHHSEAIAGQIGFDPSRTHVDLDGLKASMGVSGETESLTHRELMERRKAIQEKLEGKLDSSWGGSASDT
ncbi:MAG TPA: AarF/ABC1/UbiB kinase family protein [Myxococcales bacterium]|nr:AarF/ABC1/UbiB kinase family protein [Myxococcales bacterium]HIL00743.1 AarF/ABC1/UbiB kinase family protein [Myxococcales bacterium]